MTRQQPHAYRRRVLAGAFLVSVLLILVGGRQLAYSSGHPLAKHAPHSGRFAPASCAPQLADTPTPTATPTSLAATAAGTPVAPITLDQAQLDCTGGLNIRWNPTQTLTVGVSGALTRVDIPLCAPAKNARIDVTVSTTRSSPVSSTASLTLRHDYSDCAWYEFIFAHPLTAAAGDVLQLQVSSPNHRSALWGEEGQSDDPYPHGVGSWRGHTINDFAFQTYMR